LDNAVCIELLILRRAWLNLWAITGYAWDNGISGFADVDGLRGIAVEVEESFAGTTTTTGS